LLERLEELASTVKQLRKPNELSINLIFTNPEMFERPTYSREGTPTAAAIKAVKRVMRKIETLSHTYIIASAIHPADPDRYLLLDISRMPEKPPTGRMFTDNDCYQTESDTESVYDMDETSGYRG
jgi:hypothetical protein